MIKLKNKFPNSFIELNKSKQFLKNKSIINSGKKIYESINQDIQFDEDDLQIQNEDPFIKA